MILPPRCRAAVATAADCGGLAANVGLRGGSVGAGTGTKLVAPPTALFEVAPMFAAGFANSGTGPPPRLVATCCVTGVSVLALWGPAPARRRPRQRLRRVARGAASLFTRASAAQRPLRTRGLPVATKVAASEAPQAPTAGVIRLPSNQKSMEEMNVSIAVDMQGQGPSVAELAGLTGDETPEEKFEKTKRVIEEQYRLNGETVVVLMATQEQIEEAKASVRKELEAQGEVVPGDFDVHFIKNVGQDDGISKDDPEEKYKTDKLVLQTTWGKGQIHVVEATASSLLARKPEDDEVRRLQVLSRIRMRMWTRALEAAVRWREISPTMLQPHITEAVALVGLGRYGEGRARFAQLCLEMQSDKGWADELQDCLARVDELWIEPRPDEAQLSARPVSAFSGMSVPSAYLPNFADSIGPVRVAQCNPEELGGGAVHQRKLVATRAVPAGGLLFVQGPLFIGTSDMDDHMNQLCDALLVLTRTEPRMALHADLLLAAEYPMPDEQDTVSLISDKAPQRATWSNDPEETLRLLMDCKKIIDRHMIRTGRYFCGVWTLASMARHSCVPTANFQILGETMFARAARDLKPGDEISFGLDDSLFPVAFRDEMFLERPGGGFICTCARCNVERKLGLTAISKGLERNIDANISRIQAVVENIRLLTRGQEAAISKYVNGEKEIPEGLLGFADLVKAAEGDATPEELENMKTSVPRELTQDVIDDVEIPEDLCEEVLEAMQTFEDKLKSHNFEDEQAKNWFLTSHFKFYMQSLLISRKTKDVQLRFQRLGTMARMLECTVPGSIAHVRIVHTLYEVSLDYENQMGMQKESPHSKILRKQVSSAIRLRFGDDVSPAEELAIMARLAKNEERDDNAVWEVSHAIGRFF